MASTTPHSSAAPARAGRREWTALVVLLLALLLVSMDVSVLYFAVPFISRELGPSATEQLWIFDIYGFVLGGLLLTMGALGDRTGRRRLLLGGALAFGLASVLAAYATSPGMLIAARGLLGIGGATLMPSTLALIRNLFHDARQRASAIAIWSAVMVSGVALGPVISGVLLAHFWWGSVFLINLPAMVLLLALAPVLVPEFRNPLAGRFDWPGSLLSLAAILPVIYGIKELAAQGYDLTYVLAILAGIAVGLFFVHRQRTIEHPLLALSLFRRPGFGAAVATNLVAMFLMVGFAIFSTQYLQSVLGMSPLRAALWSLVPSLAVGTAAPLSVRLARRVNRASLVGAGFAIAAVGFLVLSRIQVDTPLWGALMGAGIYAAGIGVISTLITDLVVATAPPERAGAASGLLECVSEFGGALGMALLGSVGTAVYRAEFTDTVPASAPDAAVEHARETLGGAVAVSGQLPAQAGEAVLAAARESFTHGMRTAALVGLAICLIASVLSALRLRRAGAPPPVHTEAAMSPGAPGDMAAPEVPYGQR